MSVSSGSRTISSAFALTASVLGQQAIERLTCEVATVRPSSPDAPRGGGIKALPGGEVYDAKNVPAKLMISLMYKIPLRQITGGPGWLDTERFDVSAKAAKPSNINDLHIKSNWAEIGTAKGSGRDVRDRQCEETRGEVTPAPQCQTSVWRIDR